MSKTKTSELARLRSDYQSVLGFPFAHFFCPILYKDLDAELCRAHIINQAFVGSPRTWTLQLKDVDNFYGAFFESEFALRWKAGDEAIVKALSDKTLARKLRARILMDGVEVPHFFASGDMPARFTSLLVQGNSAEFRVGLKMSAHELIAAANRNWELAVDKDVRVPAMVTVVKSAYLTLVTLLGYRYVLSDSAAYVGRDMLGKFYIENRGLPNKRVMSNAYDFFRPYAAMVRPLEVNGLGLTGTISDGIALAGWCPDASPWAVLVFVKTGELMSSVLMPAYTTTLGQQQFLAFINGQEGSVKGSFCRFQKDHFDVETQEVTINWPRDGVLFPE